ncbi:hypothetical protein L1047_06880 [Synechococcus sp. Nb3U1]|uniref:hypothetical protein n=1 Tax=Synechococcus sp. Nb3U1 TaxID=1914529 RepID=UPI001F3B61C1|nr:hypothetical protein [Synechococcus sp. Nb3U1]MCF2970917.1 hypothetical protein [Synechococcus sp. Nb3U1]
MSYSQEPQPTREVQYTVTVDEEMGAVTLSSQFSREEIDNRIQEFSQATGDVEEETQEGLFPVKKIWWCVTCQSGVRRSAKAYTEVDAGFGVCGVQSFGMRRSKCPGD